MKDIITYTNAKFGNMIAQVNMPMGISCNPDAPCFKGCYCNKGNMNYKNIKKAHKDRYDLYKEDGKKFFEKINSELYFRPSRFFRWHSSGDIVDMDYLDGMCKVARKNRETQFLCFTKQYKIVNEYFNTHRKPKNLIICLSSWGSWIPENPHNFPTAWVQLGMETDELIPKDANICGGNCAECINTSEHCWKMQKGESVAFHKH